MRLYGIAIITLVSALAFGCRSAPPPKPYHVQVRDLGIRSSPNGVSDVVGRLDYKQAVNPLGEEGGWVKVRVEGWVPRSALTRRNLDNVATNSIAEFESLVDGVVHVLTNGVPDSPKSK